MNLIRPPMTIVKTVIRSPQIWVWDEPGVEGGTNNSAHWLTAAAGDSAKRPVSPRSK